MTPDLVGKSVALVGNSSAGLKRTLGKEIDAHDVVIRMNAGAPDTDEQCSALGSRTDIIAVGTLECLEANAGLLRWDVDVWFWKATVFGDRQWEELSKDALRPSTWRVPKEWIQEAGEAVGSKPSGGICLMHLLLKHLKPESLSVFNIDFFGVLGGGDDSWWHTERPEAVVTQRHHPHNGPKEFAYFRRLGFTKKEDGWWTWTHSTGELAGSGGPSRHTWDTCVSWLVSATWRSSSVLVVVGPRWR